MIKFFSKGKNVFSFKRKFEYDEIDHSVVIYLINQKNQCIGMYDPEGEFDELYS